MNEPRTFKDRIKFAQKLHKEGFNVNIYNNCIDMYYVFLFSKQNGKLVSYHVMFYYNELGLIPDTFNEVLLNNRESLLDVKQLVLTAEV